MQQRRTEALRQYMPMVLERIHNAANGLTLQQLSRQTAGVPGFVQALRNQRASLLQFVQLFPDQVRIEKRGTQNVLLAKVPRARVQEPQAAALLRVQEPDVRPQEPQAAVRPRVQEPETREERNARLDALLQQNRANVEAAQARARERKLETLKLLRASQARTERDLR